MKRREFIALFGGAAAVWPRAARAQQVDRIRRIGVLMPYAQDDPETSVRVTALREGLLKLGWTEGQNVRFEYRYWSASDLEAIRRIRLWRFRFRPSHTGAATTCTPNDEAAPLRGSRNRCANGDVGGLNKYITRSVRGTISISNSSHLLVIVGGRLLNPVALPPGCGKLTTNPLPTGSARGGASAPLCICGRPWLADELQRFGLGGTIEVSQGAQDVEFGLAVVQPCVTRHYFARVAAGLGFVHLELADVGAAPDVGIAEGDQVGAEESEGECVIVVRLGRGAEFVLGAAHAEVFEVAGHRRRVQVVEIEREGVWGRQVGVRDVGEADACGGEDQSRIVGGELLEQGFQGEVAQLAGGSWSGSTPSRMSSTRSWRRRSAMASNLGVDGPVAGTVMPKPGERFGEEGVGGGLAVSLVPWL